MRPFPVDAMRPSARPAGFRLSRIGASLAGRAGGLLAAVLVALQPLTAGLAEAQVITDPTAPIEFRPRVGVSPRGAPVVDITAPSLGGLSHNKFRAYNVDTRGLILNNSGLGGTSVLGGEIGANPNLVGRRPASVILNEVTGTASSLLNGPTEVFGAKADVIVANPNGVTCRSCAFLNTGRVTLSTGVPVPDYTTGTVGFAVRRGTVSIEGTGVSAPDGALSRIDLVGRQLAIDGAVTASERVRLRAGAVHWDQQSDVATPLAGVDIPAVSGPAIRSSAAGTVSAGSISVLSRDLDLGVHLTGTLSAGEGDLVVRSLGDLSLAGAAAAGDLDLKAEGALSLAGDHAAAGRLTARGRDVTVAAGARLAANEHIVAEAIRSLDSRGTLAAGGAISLRASGTLFATGTASALGNVAIEADDVTTDGFVAAGRHISVSGLGRIRLDATGLAAETDVTVAAPDLTLGEGTAFSAPGRVTLAARETLTNATVLDYPDLALTVGKRFENRATGALVQDHLALTASEAIVNAGTLYGRLTATLASDVLTNEAGGVVYGPELTLAVAGDLTNLGRILSPRSLAIVAGDVTNTGGVIASDGALTLRSASYRAGSAASLLSAVTADLIVAGAFDNGGRAIGAESLALAAGSLANRAGASLAGGLVALAVTDNVDNAGVIEALGLVEAEIGGVLANAGRIESGGAIGIAAGGTIANSGTVKAAGDIFLAAAGLTNAAGAHVEGDNVTLALAGALVNAGIVDAAGALQLEAASLDSRGAAGSLAVLSGKTLTALVAGHLANRAHSVLQGRDGAAVQAATTDLDLTRAGGADRGTFNFGRDLALTLTGQGLTIGAGEQLIVDGSLALAVAGNLTVLGTIASRSFLGLASTGGSILVGRNDPGNPGGGVLFTRGDADIRAAGDLRNHASVIEALGDMAITVGGTVLNTRTDVGISNYDYVIPGGTDAYGNEKTQYETSGAATIQADGRLAISAGTVRNLASSILAGTDLVITAGTVENLARTLTMTQTAIRKGVFYGPYVYAVGETPALFHAGGAFSANASGSFTNTGTVQSQTAQIKAPAITIGITDRNLPTAAPRLPDAAIDLAAYAGAVAAPKPVTVGDVTFLNGAPIPGGTDERSPGWILAEVGDVRGPITVFADPTTERRLIREALIEQTGRAILDPAYRNPVEQQEALYQGTVAFLKANPDIRLGQVLTADEKARIAEPILWYEEKLIDGRPVLVPQLLLPEDRLGEWVKGAGGELIAGDILLEGERVHNTGAILAENTLTITAGEFLNEQRAAWTAQGRYAWQELQSGGLIVADSLLITTERDLVNRGGVLIGNDSLALKAGGDVILEAQQIANSLFEGSKKRWTRIDTVEHAAGLVASGGDLTIAAGGNLIVAGSTVTAAEDATLAAGGEIVISSVVDVTDVAAGGRKGNALRRSSFGYSEHEERNVASLISAGGNLTVAAAGDVTVVASHLAAGEDLTVAAGAGADGREDASVRILAGQDVRDTAYWKKTSGVGLHFGDGWMDVYRSKKVASTTAEVANVASSLTAGGNVDISAKGDIDIVGSAIAAAEEARLAAGRDVTIAPGMEAEGSTYSRKVSGVGIGVSAGNGSVSLSIGAHRDSLYQAHEKTVAEASLIQGGSGVVITAGRDVTATAADIVSGGDIAVTAQRDLALLAATEVERELEIRKQSFVGLKAEVSQNVSGALEQLKGAASTFNSGYGNDAYKAIGMASGIMQGVDAALQLSNPTLSGSITAGASSSTSRQWAYGETARPTTLTAAGDLTLTAGRDMHLEGTQAVAGQDLILDVGRDLVVESAQSGYGSFRSSSSKSFGVGVGASVSLTSGATVGLTANGSIAHARDQMSGLQNLNARLDAGETLIIVTGRDATLAGANASGQDVLLDIGGDLTVASRQDVGHGESRSSSIGGSVFVGVGTSPVSGSVSVGAGRGSSDHAWVSDQTSIIALDTLHARVEGHTQIDGAVIASLTGDLTLDTGTLGFSDIHDHDKGSSWSAQAGISASTGEKGKAGYTPTGAPTGASLSGHVAEHDREQETRATVGAGEIIIRDTENQTQDIAALNRDLDKAQEITKDERSGVEFYVSSSAAQQVINAANVGMAALYDILMRRAESADDDDLVTGSIASQLESLGGGKPRQVTTPKGATQFIFPNGLIIRFDLLPGQYLSGQVPHINLEVPGIGNHHINLK
ncbi:filamentous hemagglutinin [Chelatococcus caeni]|uniref:Filamentous hemagglutinin n=1 Tax=Chelatococcus caeni TaxID=1348468 RepID=A0A840BVR0_9HYPH|nr:hemagglutinin repeat-containing protein [Chelatococcus caeni]MBB4017445.1 filamentous hemagglutinin [Chelatococcus caeni]